MFPVNLGQVLIGCSLTNGPIESEVLQMSFEDIQEKRLRKLNQKLRDIHIPPFDEKGNYYQKTGNYKKAEWEFTGEIPSYYAASEPWIVVPTFEMREPISGEKTLYATVFPQKHGVIVVPIVNRSFIVVVKQHRFQIGQWTLELPRGWNETSKDIARDLLKKEVPSLFQIGSLEFVEQISRPIYEDSGSRPSKASYFMVGFQTLAQSKIELLEKLRSEGKQKIKPLVLDINEIEMMVDGGGIDDNHSIVAWYFTKKHLKKMFHGSSIE
jgi:hypothetical protein